MGIPELIQYVEKGGVVALLLVAIFFLIGGGIYAGKHVWNWLKPYLEKAFNSHVELMESLKSNDARQTEILEEQRSILKNHSEALVHHGKVLQEHSNLLGQHGVLLKDISVELHKQGEQQTKRYDQGRREQKNG